MRIAILSPIAWRTPPEHCGAWERVVSLLAEGLVARGVDVTLFATKDSHTTGKLVGVCPRGCEEDQTLAPEVWSSLHVSALFERGDEFDLIHNHFGYLPLTYTAMTSTPLLTTLSGAPSPDALRVYGKYDERSRYVSISDADRSPGLTYLATVHPGIDLSRFVLQDRPGDYLLFLGPIHKDSGAREAIEIAKRTGMKLVLAGAIQDGRFFESEVGPHLDGNRIARLDTVANYAELLGGAHALLSGDGPFSLALVDAMACGTPVIAFNRGSMSEVVRHEVTGFLVSGVEQAVAYVPRVRELDRRACRKHVEERFSAHRMVSDYIKLYKDILAGQTRTSRGAWGYHDLLSDDVQLQVKKIVIHPGKDLSLQLRHTQAACWVIVQGQALATLDARDIALGEGRSLEISRGTSRQLKNVGEKALVLVEVQGEKDKVA